MTGVLHRCRTPTDWLCPCGRVARELRAQRRRLQEGRVPGARPTARRSSALTGQRHVPLLELDGEAICDSVRIVEHLHWRAAGG